MDFPIRPLALGSVTIEEGKMKESVWFPHECIVYIQSCFLAMKKLSRPGDKIRVIEKLYIFNLIFICKFVRSNNLERVKIVGNM